jgi:hypothetical protein
LQTLGPVLLNNSVVVVVVVVGGGVGVVRSREERGDRRRGSRKG